jgi:Holliday junction resolvasome RuvABC endonuclease subunit
VFGELPAALIAHFLRERGPHVVVIERPFVAKFGQTTMGTADHIWRKRVEEAGLKRRIVRVYPASWRARVLGKGWASASRELVRARENVVASAIAEIDDSRKMHPDAAPAICIGKWACFAGEVLAVLPRLKSEKRKS